MTALRNSDVCGVGKVLLGKVDIWNCYDLGWLLTKITPLNHHLIEICAYGTEEAPVPINSKYFSKWGRFGAQVRPLPEDAYKFKCVLIMNCPVVPLEDRGCADIDSEVKRLFHKMDTCDKVKKDIEKVLGKGTVDKCRLTSDIAKDNEIFFEMSFIITVPSIAITPI